MNANNFHEGADTKTRQHIPIIDGDKEVPSSNEAAQHSDGKEINHHHAAQPEKHTPSSAGTIILQWLTYAFWGWLIVGLIWLIALILTNVLTDNASAIIGMLPYAIAGTIVILPIALACDLVYRKKEPQKKAGGATVIMVIHAVLFALLGIAALITAVFTLINTTINIDRDTTPQIITAITAGSAAVLYALAFVRTVQPLKKNLSIIYSIIMGGITALLLALAVAGPLVSSFATRDDRIIERNIDSVHAAVERYTNTEGKLPKSLNDISTTNSVAQKLIEDGKIEYIAIDTKKEVNPDTGASQTTFRYQLCVVYKQANNARYNTYDSDRSDGYSYYPQTYSHDAGRVCHKLLVEKTDKATLILENVQQKQKSESIPE